MIPATAKQYKSGHDEAMDLVKEQTAALEVTRKLLEACQIQNERLVKTLRYYAQTDWREVSMKDRGQAARTILNQEVGR